MKPLRFGDPSRRTVLSALGAGFCLPTLCLAGCRSGRPPSVDFSEGSRNFLPDDYRDVFDRWTRHARLLSANEGAVIEAWATLKSWEYREAYVEKFAASYSLSREDKAALRAAEIQKARQFYDFHLTVQTTDFRWNDLHKRDSTWRISLSDGTGDEIYPEDVEQLRLPAPYELVFFPERTAFSRAYSVRFDKPDPESLGPVSGELILRITGPMGGIALNWRAS